MNRLFTFFSNLQKRWPNLLPVLFLLIATVIGHHAWIRPEANLTYGDWRTTPNGMAGDFFKGWNAWSTIGDLGSPNISLSFLPFTWTWASIVHLGGTFALGVHLTFFWPIAILSLLAPYFLARRFGANPLVAVAAALVYGCNSYFLIMQNGQLTVAFVVALIPLLYLYADKFLSDEQNVAANMAIFAVLFSLALAYELRITLIATLLIIGYGLTKFSELWRRRYYLLGLIGLILLLNSFWILPFILGGGGAATDSVTSRSIFGDWLATIRYALADNQWSWTGGATPNGFTPEPILWYAWIPSALALLGLASLSNQRDRKVTVRTLYFAGVALVGILLVKQSDEPFRGLYLWLYEHLPLFNIYRESSKFYPVTTIGYFGLILVALKWLEERKKWVYWLLTLVLISVCLYSFRPLINGQFGGLFVHRPEPAPYVALEKITDADPTWFRTVWAPTDSNWSDVGLLHPRLNLTDLSQGPWRGAENVPPAVAIPTLSDTTAPLLTPYAANLLNQSGIRYIIIPQYYDGSEQSFLNDYPSRQRYAQVLDSLPYLHRVNLGVPDFIIYENSTFLPRFYLTDQPVNAQAKPVVNSSALVHWTMLDSGRYQLTIDKATSDLYLQFPETYNSGWNLYVNRGWFTAFFGKPLAGVVPERTDFGLNQYHLTLAQLVQEGVAHRQADGTYTLTLTLMYHGQLWFYRGIAISAVSSALLLGWAVGLIIVRKRRHA